MLVGLTRDHKSNVETGETKKPDRSLSHIQQIRRASVIFANVYVVVELDFEFFHGLSTFVKLENRLLEAYVGGSCCAVGRVGERELRGRGCIVVGGGAG